jgi:hypothetical protein
MAWGCSQGLEWLLEVFMAKTWGRRGELCELLRLEQCKDKAQLTWGRQQPRRPVAAALSARCGVEARWSGCGVTCARQVTGCKRLSGCWDWQVGPTSFHNFNDFHSPKLWNLKRWPSRCSKFSILHRDSLKHKEQFSFLSQLQIP